MMGIKPFNIPLLASYINKLGSFGVKIPHNRTGQITPVFQFNGNLPFMFCFCNIFRVCRILMSRILG